MKYCSECGYQCSDDAKFCGLCGFSFEEAAAEAEEIKEQVDVEESIAEETEAQGDAEESVAEETEAQVDAEELVPEPDTKEYYKQQMLQNKQMIDDLKEQQRQMQLQMQTMQQQQWNQTQQQQRQQKMINHYNSQISQQRMEAQAQNKGTPIRNIWSLVAAVLCVLPFFLNNFVRMEMLYYEASYGIVEFCSEMIDYATYTSDTSISGWITSMLPIFVLVLVVILIIGGYKPVYKVRGWVVVINLIAVIVTFFYIKGEGHSDVSFGAAFWILVVGIVLAAYSCGTDNHEIGLETSTLSYDDIKGPSYNLSLLAADSSLELKQEWRCPKCDSKNPIDYKYCKTCSTARG